MNYDTKTTKAIYRSALLLVASMLAACGGGDDDAASSCKNPLLLIPCILDGQIPTSVDATTPLSFLCVRHCVHHQSGPCQLR